MACDYFNRRHLGVVKRTIPLAEELTGDHFRLASFNEKFPYEVLTLKEWPDLEPAAGAFAELRKLTFQKKYPTNRELAPYIYRICLVDPNILKCLERRPPLLFEALMLYILTHELVHVVRFSKFFSHFEDDREAEESRVHAITNRILSGVPQKGLSRVLESYERLC